MNTEQQNAVDVALQGHNLLITGAAGTGKSFVLSYIYKTMKDRGINVHLTCTTGVSCAVYPTGMATTVHRFAGILDCRHGSSEIRDVLRSNRKFDEVVQRINETDVLIIDECSMLSKRTFEILNAACQLKDASKFFGGMQLILCGDFLQLPPVANNLYRDDGSFCFESSIFYNVVPHKVVLCEIMRQSAAEAEFKQVISEVCKGNVSEKSSHFIECLSRPLPETQHFEPTLFATNQQVDSFNRNNILEMPGVLYEFQSADTGENRYLDRLTCQKVLWLKIGMPVILIRNLTDNLYNGLRGIVHDIDKDGPSVTFPTGTIRIQKVTFDVFSPSVNANIASRIQYPLKPAFGITIHKAQGMTLERVNVDCQQIFKPGQLGVALSRARSCEGIRVINYDPKYCIRQPQIISDFISEDTVPVNEDVSCCKGLLTRLDDVDQTEQPSTTSTSVPDGNDIEIDFVDEKNEEEFDEEFDSIIEAISQEEDYDEVKIPDNFSIDTVLQSLKYTNVFTESQMKVNHILDNICMLKLQLFVKKQFSKLTEFVKELQIDENSPKAIPNSVLTLFCKNIHEYSTSAEYRLQCLVLFETDNTFSHEHMHICFNILSEIRKFLTKEKVDLYEISKKNIGERKITNSSRARVRYVGGYCVNKVRAKYLKSTRSHMFSTSEEGQILYEESLQSLNILNSLREEETNVIASTNEPDSLIDIERRQNLQRGLTNISDELFHFFTELTNLCLNSFISKNLIIYGENVFNECLSKILRNESIHAQFLKLVSRKFTHESSSSLLLKKENNDEEEIPFILNRLVISAAQTNAIFDDIVKTFMMVFLAQFRKDVKGAYKVKKTMAHRKQVKVSECKTDTKKQSKKKKKDAETPSTSTDLAVTIDTPSTSTVSAEIVLCKVCQLDHENDDWIQCDKCNGWFHRVCAGLKNTRWWKKYSAEGANWICKVCKKK